MKLREKASQSISILVDPWGQLEIHRKLQETLTSDIQRILENIKTGYYSYQDESEITHDYD